jgi:hypothetical protein
MPIDHRSSAVVAMSEELDAWLKAMPAREMTEIEELRARVAHLEAENLELKRRIAERALLRPPKRMQSRGGEYSA